VDQGLFIQGFHDDGLHQMFWYELGEKGGQGMGIGVQLTVLGKSPMRKRNVWTVKKP
jgi:hypothetical protein